MSIDAATSHLGEIAKYVAGAGIIAITGWLGSSQIHTLNDVARLQEDVVHHEQFNNSVGMDLGVIRSTNERIAESLGEIEGTEKAQAQDLSDVKREVHDLATKLGHQQR